MSFCLKNQTIYTTCLSGRHFVKQNKTFMSKKKVLMSFCLKKIKQSVSYFVYVVLQTPTPISPSPSPPPYPHSQTSYTPSSQPKTQSSHLSPLSPLPSTPSYAPKSSPSAPSTAHYNPTSAQTPNQTNTRTYNSKISYSFCYHKSHPYSIYQKSPTA